MAYSLEHIEKLADEIHKAIPLNGNTVDIVKIANELGYKVYFSSFTADGVAGMVISDKDKKHIYVNKDDIPQRQRFTIAHEIGHIVLHHDIDKPFRQIDYREVKQTFDVKEWEANSFASALLMPKHKAISVWEKLQDVDDFADAFYVSKLAASIRLQNLGLI